MFGNGFLHLEIGEAIGRFWHVLRGLFSIVGFLLLGMLGLAVWQLWAASPHAGHAYTTTGAVKRVWSPVAQVLSVEAPEVGRRASGALRACSVDFVALSGWSIHRWAGVAPGSCGRSGAAAFGSIPAMAVDAGRTAERQASVLVQEARFGRAPRPEPSGPVWNRGWQR